MDPSTPVCSARACDKPARMAVTTRRPQRDNCVVTVYTDDRADKVPVKSSRYCNGCGRSVVAGLLEVLVDTDD